MRIFPLVILLSIILLTACNTDDYRVKIGGATDFSTVHASWITQLGATTKAFPGADHSNYDVCWGTAVDSSGNVYCAGKTSDDVGEVNGGNGAEDAIIVKLNSSGELLWVRQLGAATQASSAAVVDTSGGDYCYGIAVDTSDNVYCTGRTNGNLGGVNSGSWDGFVVKLNSDGEVQWLTQFGSVNYDECSGVAVDGLGNVFCGGYTWGSFGEANGGGGNMDAFVTKLDPAGVVNWTRQIGTPTAIASAEVNDASSNEQCDAVAVDSDGDVYCAGVTSGAFGESFGGTADGFILKLDTTGAVVWLRQIGADTEASSPLVNDTSQREHFRAVTVDNSGNVIAGGYTQGTIGEANGGGNDILLVKYDTNGVLTWLSQVGTATEASSAAVIDTAAGEACVSLAADSSGNIYCAGETGSTLGETPGDWQWDPMVMKFNSSGTVQWIKQFGSVTFPNPLYYGGMSLGVAVDSSGYVYTTGEIYGDTSEAQGGGDNGDLFIAKINPDGTMDW